MTPAHVPHRPDEGLRTPVTVNVLSGSATFIRTGSDTAELSVINDVPDLQADLTAGMPSAVERICRAEIAMHVRTFIALHATLMQSLDHEGRGTSHRTKSNWSFRRQWQTTGGTLDVASTNYQNDSRIRFDMGVSEAALVTCELRNQLRDRIEGVQDLYANILRDMLAQQADNETVDDA